MTRYRVDGMTCEGCAKSVTKAIRAIAPGAVVEVDLEGKAVAVEGVDDEKALAGAIEDAGFDFGGRA
jgi:copper chaperone